MRLMRLPYDDESPPVHAGVGRDSKEAVAVRSAAPASSCPSGPTAGARSLLIRQIRAPQT